MAHNLHLRMVKSDSTVDRITTKKHREKASRYADALLRSITNELYAADFFTREDLLHTSAFLHVATITRYHMVCLAVRHLIRKRQLAELNRTELCLASKTAAYPGGVFYEAYLDSIRQLLRGFKTKEAFTVMDLVNEWKSDPQLTINNKRVAARRALAKFVKQKLVEKVNEFEYSRMTKVDDA